MKNSTQSNILKIGLFALVLVLVGAGCTKVSNNTNVMMETSVPTNTMMMDKNEERMMQKSEGEMMDTKGETNMMKDETHMDEKMNDKMEDTSMKKMDKMEMMEKASSGTYEDYSPEKIAFASEGKVVLFFHAPWCPTCKALDGDINAELSQIPSNTKILKVDYESSTELKKKYGVTYQHTLVQVDAQGNMITKWSGGNTLESLLEKIK